MMSKHDLHPHTIKINREQKKQSRKARNNALIWLAKTFPQSFDNDLRIRPLKKGILQDILAFAPLAAEAGISKAKLREAVVIFTRRIDYLACLKAREIRIDLQGQPHLAVTPEEAERAAIKIRKRVEKSLKIAKKPTSPKLLNSGFLKPMASYTSHTYLQEENNLNRTKSNPPCTIKHKPVRQYDPTAVARLKEKLGLNKS